MTRIIKSECEEEMRACARMNM